MLGNTSELKSENSKGPRSGSLHDTNQANLKYNKKWMFEEAYVRIVWLGQVAPDLYFQF